MNEFPQIAVLRNVRAEICTQHVQLVACLLTGASQPIFIGLVSFVILYSISDAALSLPIPPPHTTH